MPILAANVTRVAGQFTLSLIRVEPINVASLSQSENYIKFILPDYGNPGGVFSFGPEMNDTYIIQVGLPLTLAFL